jgi:hypothetical protein
LIDLVSYLIANSALWHLFIFRFLRNFSIIDQSNSKIFEEDIEKERNTLHTAVLKHMIFISDFSLFWHQLQQGSKFFFQKIEPHSIAPSLSLPQGAATLQAQQHLCSGNRLPLLLDSGCTP